MSVRFVQGPLPALAAPLPERLHFTVHAARDFLGVQRTFFLIDNGARPFINAQSLMVVAQGVLVGDPEGIAASEAALRELVRAYNERHAQAPAAGGKGGGA